MIESGAFSYLTAFFHTLYPIPPVLTRNQVAQLALNALRSNMVTFTGTPGIEVNGVVIGYKAEYTERTSPEAKYNAIADLATTILTDNGQFYIQLGEQLYDGDLRLSDKAVDDFGRPARYWEYDGKEIGTFVKKELLRQEWTGEVTGKDLYDLLGKSTIEDKDYDFFIYVDGEDRYNASNGASGVNTVFNKTQMNKNNKAGVGGTGTGVLTQVFLDANKHEVTVSVINTYLARAKADYNEKRDEVSFNVYAIDKATANSTDYYWKNLDRPNDQKETMLVSGEDFNVADVKENDTFLVTVADGEIQTLVAPEVISAATLDSFKKNSNVVAEGTTYKYTTTAQYNVEVLDDYTGDSNYGVNLKDKHYNIYLDAYGNLIGIDLVENADNYVFITGVDSKNSNLAAKNYDANAIFLDGTMETITFDNEKSELNTPSVTGKWALANTWCTYTVNSKGVYTLKQVQLPATAGTVDGQTVATGDSLVGLKVGGKTVKVGQYHDLMNNTTGNSVSNEIDVKHVSLRGSMGTAAPTGRPAFKYVYGNDNSVYLNTELKGIDATGEPANAGYRGVINKVTSVTTGIKNAGLEIMDETAAIQQAKKNSGSRNIPPAAGNVAYGSYVLYNDKGYVIAAVTVGNDSSASENLVYVHSSSVEMERYDPATDEWTWTRKVVHNGEEVLLTEVGDGISVLKGMQQHNWYVVSYNAKGEVIAKTHAADDADVDYVDAIASLESTIQTAGVETVLYERSLYSGLTSAYPNGCPDFDSDTDSNYGDPHTAKELKNGTGPKLEGSTFYDVTTDTTGYYVSNDVKVVFIQKNKNVWETEFKSGKTDLENVISDLIKEDTCEPACGHAYRYEVSAVIVNGIAQVVVIRDLHVQGDSGSYDTPTALTVTITGDDISVTGITTETVDQIATAIRNKLAAEGFTDINITVSGGAVTGVTAKKNSISYTFSLSGDLADPADTTVSSDKATMSINRGANDTAAITAPTNGALTTAAVAANAANPGVNTTKVTAALAAGTLTVTAAADADFGKYDVTVNGTKEDGTAANPVTIVVTVAPRAATVTAASATLTGNRASASTLTTTVTVNNGGTPAADGALVVTPETEGNAGVTAAIATAAGTSTVTVTVAADADLGDYTVTVPGLAEDGTTAATPATITVTIAARTASVTLGTATGTGTSGTAGTASSTVSVTASVGATVNEVTVAKQGGGATTGVTATLDTTKENLTVSWDTTAVAGTYEISVSCTLEDGTTAGTPATFTLTIS